MFYVKDTNKIITILEKFKCVKSVVAEFINVLQLIFTHPDNNVRLLISDKYLFDGNLLLSLFYSFQYLNFV